MPIGISTEACGRLFNLARSSLQQLQDIQAVGFGGDVGRGQSAVGAADGADEKRGAKDELRGFETISGTELGILG